MPATLPTSAEMIGPAQTAAQQKVDITAVLDFLAERLCEFTTTGTAVAFVGVPVPAITAYFPLSCRIVTHVAAGLNPTVQLSGLPVPTNLVYKLGDGSLANINGNMPAGTYRGTALSATQLLVHDLPLVPIASGGTGATTAAAARASLGAPGLEMMHVRDEKAANAGAGTSAVGSQVRTLNTVVLNTIVGASLAANQITLPAGTYRVFASAPAFKAESHRLRLVNATDATVALLGFPEFSSAAGLACTASRIEGRLVLAAAKTFNLTHHFQAAQVGNGLGVPTGDTFAEVYANLMIWKE